MSNADRPAPPTESVSDEDVITALWEQLDEFSPEDLMGDEGVALVQPLGCTDEQYERCIIEVTRRKWPEEIVNG